jgi:hypothetical protein
MPETGRHSGSSEGWRDPALQGDLEAWQAPAQLGHDRGNLGQVTIAVGGDRNEEVWHQRLRSRRSTPARLKTGAIRRLMMQRENRDGR